MKHARRIIILAGVVLGGLILFPLAAGAVTQPDAIAGLAEVLSKMGSALSTTLDAMLEAYGDYLGAL